MLLLAILVQVRILITALIVLGSVWLKLLILAKFDYMPAVVIIITCIVVWSWTWASVAKHLAAMCRMAVYGEQRQERS